EILADIKKISQIFEITLNVGLGTFKPIKTDYVEEHFMHREHFHIQEDVKNSINDLKKDNKKLLAVGTTTVRALESASEGNKLVNSGHLSTDIFIRGGYKFKIVDAILTNFHLPKSTLFVMVCTFGGEKLIKEAYTYAIKNRFRFFSYGDAMLIL
ncbi:MAG: S-adenosylmethionine:tRNA ribosyltransferase-isomerase, partial [Calditerrivibrio sp.]|nr:S-adenosylmethionine:tRNA ribosyltransferase-isomerase [Calditerrivibrio sp.]